MLSELLRHGMDINACDWYGRSLLHHVSSGDSIQQAEILIAAGVNINAVDHQSNTTPLELAAWTGTRSMVELLLQHRADLLLPDDACIVRQKAGTHRNHGNSRRLLNHLKQISARRSLRSG
jgi:ankyrin repeat protein